VIWRPWAAYRQRRYHEWPYGSRRSGPSGLWFAQAEAQFSLAGISSEKTKFFHVISQLDHRYAAEVEDIITSPPERDPYTAPTTATS
jgi:hypothetical protein